jgi:ABC-2 type transport system permease protein
MFMFCGTLFPVTNLPKSLQVVAEFLPLTHSVRLGRLAVMAAGWEPTLLWDLLYIVGVASIIMFLAVKRLGKRMVK